MPGQLTHEAVIIRNHPTIRGVLVYDADAAPRLMIMLLGPHPLMGGSMENPVTTQLADALAHAGYLALRFDYRTLDAGELAENMAHFWRTGHAPCDDSLITDSAAVRDWLTTQFHLPLCMVGYSFGAHVAAQLLEPVTQGLVMIAPTVAHHNVLPDHAHVPKLVVYTDNDFATPLHTTEHWFSGLPGEKQKLLIPAADHFFKQHQNQINAAVLSFFSHLAPLSREVLS